MQVNQVSNYSATGASGAQSNSAATSSAVSKAMDATNFMTLLMAQLTHQNPLEPLKDSEMLSQFAQLNSVQQLTTISKLMTDSASSNQTGYAASLIGKNVTASQSNGNPINGVVTAISIEGGKVYVHIGDQLAALNDVTEIQGA